MKIYRDVIKTMLLGAGFSLVLGTLLTVSFCLNTPQDTGYAGRWNSSCPGWDRASCLLHVIPDVITWMVYCGIATSIALMHPAMDRVRTAVVTVTLIVFVFTTCGATHLLNAVTTFHPAYFHSGLFLSFAAVVGVFGWWFITHDLTMARQIVNQERKELEGLRRRNV